MSSTATDNPKTSCIHCYDIHMTSLSPSLEIPVCGNNKESPVHEDLLIRGYCIQLMELFVSGTPASRVVPVQCVFVEEEEEVGEGERCWRVTGASTTTIRLLLLVWIQF